MLLPANHKYNSREKKSSTHRIFHCVMLARSIGHREGTVCPPMVCPPPPPPPPLWTILPSLSRPFDFILGPTVRHPSRSTGNGRVRSVIFWLIFPLNPYYVCNVCQLVVGPSKHSMMESVKVVWRLDAKSNHLFFVVPSVECGIDDGHSMSIVICLIVYNRSLLSIVFFLLTLI